MTLPPHNAPSSPWPHDQVPQNPGYSSQGQAQGPSSGQPQPSWAGSHYNMQGRTGSQKAMAWSDKFQSGGIPGPSVPQNGLQSAGPAPGNPQSDGPAPGGQRVSGQQYPQAQGAYNAGKMFTHGQGQFPQSAMPANHTAKPPHQAAPHHGAQQPFQTPPAGPAAQSWDDGSYKPSEQDPIPLSKSSITLRSTMTRSSLVSYLVVGGFGGACLYGAVWNIVQDEGTIPAAIVLFVIGVLITLALLFMMSVRTVLDAQGIHLRAYKRSRSFPWPTSRTSFFVRIIQGGGRARYISNGADVYFVTEDGQPIALGGLSWRGPSATELEVKGVKECTRIWQWAVARGYTRETGQYVPIKGGLGIKQAMRDAQEGKFGLR